MFLVLFINVILNVLLVILLSVMCGPQEEENKKSHVADAHARCGLGSCFPEPFVFVLCRLPP